MRLYTLSLVGLTCRVVPRHAVLLSYRDLNGRGQGEVLGQRHLNLVLHGRLVVELRCLEEHWVRKYTSTHLWSPPCGGWSPAPSGTFCWLCRLWRYCCGRCASASASGARRRSYRTGPTWPAPAPTPCWPAARASPPRTPGRPCSRGSAPTR